MRTLLAAVLAAGLTGLVTADEKRTGTPAEQMKAIEKDFTARFAKANEEIPKAAADERQKLITAAISDLKKLIAEAVTLAEANADNADVAGPAVKLLAGPAAQFAGDTKGLYKKLMGSKDKTVQGVATFSYASQLADQADQTGSKAEAQEAEGLLAKVEKEFADVTVGGRKVGPQAADKLYLLRNLAVGKTAPDVEGADLDDKKVKLSSYRGKVVVLDIWATWCPPCRAMIPHEREMVKKLKDKPFLLVSISADAKKDDLTDFLKKEEMPWTHWWDGQNGPVGKAYKVRFFPTIYVIDAKGVIRHKNIRGAALEKAVEELVKEAEGTKN